MNEQIAAILAEANLSEEQIQKIAGICQEAIEADRAVIRAAHLDEVANLTEANKADLAALTTALVEARRLNTVVEMAVGESKLVLDKRRGVSIAVVAEGKTYAQTVSKAFIAEAKKMCMDSADGDGDDKKDDEEVEEGKVRLFSGDDKFMEKHFDAAFKKGGGKLLSKDDDGDGIIEYRVECDLLSAQAINSYLEDKDDGNGKYGGMINEAVKATPRRVVAKKGEAQAVGIDLDQGGSLAFTVSTIDGSAAIELSKPDSDAVKAWFSTLQEGDAMDDEEEGDEGTVEEASDFMARFEAFAGGEVKPGRVTIKGFPADLNDTDGTYMDIDAVDADAAAGLAKELKKGGFKVKRAGKTGLLVERNGKASNLEEAKLQAEDLAASILESALEPLVPVIREARMYEKVKGRLFAIQEALVNAGIVAAPVTTVVAESKDEIAALQEQIATLQADLDKANTALEEGAKEKLFAEKTKNMALTTSEKVRALVEAANPKGVEEYTTVLEAAVVTVTTPKASPTTQNLVESATGTKDDGRMAAYLSKL